MKAEEAKAKYLELASSIPLWGVTLYQVTDKQSGSVAKRVLGIAEDGILVSKGWSLLSVKDHKDCYDFYPFEKLTSWNITSDGIQINIRHAEPLSFTTTIPSPTVKDDIFSLLNDYYVMLSLEKPSELPQKEHIDYSLYKQEQMYPDYRLYFPPITRKLIDPHYSRLEHFRFCYLEECKAASHVPILKLLQQVDSHQESHKNFQSLELSGCGLRWEQLEAVAKSVTKVFKYMGSPEHKYDENMTLTSIDISNNSSAGPESVNAIGQFLQLPIPLNTLTLSNMSLGPKGAEALAPLLEQNKVVENLSIASNALGSKGASVLLNAIRRNKNYTFINISNNDLDSKFVNDVRDFFLSHITLKGISISANKVNFKHL